ncbi:helix-turn-helix transcriptional regulator [Brevundimonas sp. SH203]|uniref:helix-turn-helix domain-containing protein n=1 Tax=Brevundimonas sp. SH203 TaxID=345167 RepID=UPI000B35B3BB|nr:helix-turn-helix transcriptional regulator [Brevundimonas sp. SH203]
MEMLTERERECLRLVHAHHNSKQIARALGIKPGTVDKHCENAARKLQVENRIAAALALAALETLPNHSHPETLPMAGATVVALNEAAEGRPHDAYRRHHSAGQLARDGDHSHGSGDNGYETDDGPAPGRGNAQASGFPDARRGHDRDVLHRLGHDGREVQPVDTGNSAASSLSSASPPLQPGL